MSDLLTGCPKLGHTTLYLKFLFKHQADEKHEFRGKIYVLHKIKAWIRIHQKHPHLHLAFWSTAIKWDITSN